MNRFSLATFKIFSLSPSFSSLIVTYLFMNVCFPILSSFELLGFSNLENFWPLFLQILYSFFSLPLFICCHSWWFPTDLRYSIHSFFFSCSSDWIISIELNLNWPVFSSARLNLPVCPCSEFFFSYSIFWNFRISILFF